MPAARETAILIGQPWTCRRLEQQLELLPNRPISLGWIVTPGEAPAADDPILGALEQMEAVLARRTPHLALLSLPAAMNDLITSIRTRLRRAGVPDRFMPTLEDQVAGIGPRTHLDIDLSQLLDRPPRQIDAAAVAATLAGRRVLITGAGGSIGSELARMVAGVAPERLILVERSENALFEIDRQIARRHPGLLRRALLHDVVDAPATLRHFRELKPQVIFHAAAHKHVPMMEDHPAAAIDNNLFGTIAVADAADAVAAERFVLISTDKAVNPVSVMGMTKRLAELYVQHMNRSSGTAYCMVRFGNVLGSSGSVLETWSRQIADGGPITITDPRMTRYFMTIPEAAALVLQSAALADGSSSSGEVFLFDMGAPHRIVDLASRFARMHGLEPVMVDERGRRPGSARDGNHGAGLVGIIYTGARPGEKLSEELAFDAECMLPTRHPDINIWMLPAPEARYIEDMVRELSSVGRSRDAAALAGQLRTILSGHGTALAA